MCALTVDHNFQCHNVACTPFRPETNLPGTSRSLGGKRRRGRSCVGHVIVSLQVRLPFCFNHGCLPSFMMLWNALVAAIVARDCIMMVRVDSLYASVPSKLIVHMCFMDSMSLSTCHHFWICNARLKCIATCFEIGRDLVDVF